jgi:pimeloyl-ACP methyl ester carboxylesterase
MRPSPDPVLLLHGQPGNARDWDLVRAALAGRARTIAADRPGWDRRTRPLDLAGNARAALSVLDTHGIEQAVVVAHSLGGAIAAWLAVESPQRVSGLVLAAPSANCASLNRLDELLAKPILGSALASSALSALGVSLAVPPARRRLARRLGVQEGYLRRYASTLLNPLSWHSFVVEQQMLVHELPGLEARLGAIAAPTVVVIGSGDRIVTPASARRLASQIPDARLVTLAGATHLLVQEKPAELADLILAIADGSRSASSPGPGSGTAGVAGSSGAGTVAGSAGSAGDPGSGTAGLTGASGTAGVTGASGCGTSA